MDDTSTTCISPAMFEEFCMEYTDRMADAVHPHGAFYVHHSCGHIRHLLDLYRQTKMDAVDSLNLAPPRGMGDIPELTEAFARLGPRIAILTGLGLTQRGSDADCSEEIATVFRDAAPGKNIVFAARGADFARTKFLAGECRKHQRLHARLRKAGQIGDQQTELPTGREFDPGTPGEPAVRLIPDTLDCGGWRAARDWPGRMAHGVEAIAGPTGRALRLTSGYAIYEGLPGVASAAPWTLAFWVRPDEPDWGVLRRGWPRME